MKGRPASTWAPNIHPRAGTKKASNAALVLEAVAGMTIGAAGVRVMMIGRATRTRQCAGAVDMMIAVATVAVRSHHSVTTAAMMIVALLQCMTRGAMRVAVRPQCMMTVVLGIRGVVATNLTTSRATTEDMIVAVGMPIPGTTARSVVIAHRVTAGTMTVAAGHRHVTDLVGQRRATAMHMKNRTEAGGEAISAAPPVEAARPGGELTSILACRH